MAFVTLRNINLAYGVAPLLEGVDLYIERGERIGLLGRNGAGKSTLLKLLAGELTPDTGVVERAPDLRVAALGQEVPTSVSGTVYEVVAQGAPNDADARRSVETVLSKLDLAADAPFAPLSAGNKRRVMLARALVSEPDLLLLDEPTNHLDVASIEWLEKFLGRYDGTLLFVTHDRAFLRALTSRIIEIDRGQLYSFACSYTRYLERREQFAAEEERRDHEFDKKLAKEEVWLRQGIKARRTRNEGRKRALMRLRDQRAARRTRSGSVKLNVQEAERSGKLVIEAKKLTVGYGDGDVVSGLSTLVMRGDKIGVVGPNGCGKTTLIKALLGRLEPTGGTVRVGERVDVAYFDQLREQLDEDRSVRDNVADGVDTVEMDGRPLHVMSYLADWLFPSERANSPLAALSGGERNRLLLARLFLKPSNLLVLDEPTNDLDVETLELLEQRLVDFGGTAIIVSHDRAFLDNVVTSTLVYEGEGRFVEYAGGYTDWLSQRGASEEPATTEKKARGHKPRTARARKLTFKEQRELEALPARIEALETEQAELHEKMGDPAFYQDARDAIAVAQQRLATLEGELEQAYERWQELDAIET